MIEGFRAPARRVHEYLEVRLGLRLPGEFRKRQRPERRKRYVFFRFLSRDDAHRVIHRLFIEQMRGPRK
jgi:hypothetical protein